MNNPVKLIDELRKNPVELPWLEFKHNNYDPEMIGRDICALANSAALHERQYAYMLWGIDDKTHRVIGTDYDLQTLKKGDQELENWLRSLISGQIDFTFETVKMTEGNVGMMTITRAARQPASFGNKEFIRIGSYTKPLKDYPEIQSRLWKILQNDRFEEEYARQNLELTEALSLLGHAAYFDMMGIPQPTTFEGVAYQLTEQGCLVKQDNGLYAITNLGAILFAKNLTDFSRLSSKAFRIVQYEGTNKRITLKDKIAPAGYALEFETWINFIEALLPSKETIDSVFRKTKKTYPTITIRETLANALIHQDFGMTGCRVTVEIFSNRIEITNPGSPLIDTFRIIDNPPRTRNEKLAGLMRQLRICEEMGTGWDKIVLACELHSLPAPRIDVYEGGTRVVLFASKSFSDLSLEERLWACYLHACIKHVQGEYLTNTSLRERFGLPKSYSGTISRLIKEATASGYIKPFDPNTAPRYMKYQPAWV